MMRNLTFLRIFFYLCRHIQTWRPALIRSRLMEAIQQNHRSTIYSKPPKERIRAMQSILALCVFTVTLLGPAGWIMHHIPEYRQRSPPQP